MLAAVRRTMRPTGRLVVGFFDGEEVAAFDHKVVEAYFWPVEEMSARLARAGFAEIERMRRPAGDSHRAYAAIAARPTNVD